MFEGGHEMTEDLKNYLYVLFSKLSLKERGEIITYLKDLNLNSDLSLQDAVCEIRKKRYSNGFFCPHCSSKKVVRFGRYRERQRYLCRSCKKTFTDISKTALHCIRSKEKFFHAARLMLKGYSLTKTADRVKVSIPTAFSWRHRVLDSLRNLEDDRLSGIVEADDTYFLHSQKGNRNIGRHPRKRGGKSKKRGVSDEQVCVVVARDRSDNTVSDIATFGRPSTEQIDRVLGKSLSKDSIFLSDKHRSFRGFAIKKKLQYKSLNLSKGIRVVRGIYHIQNVNSYHSRLKVWMKRFKGVATKYLSNYLHWFEFIDGIGRDKIQNAAERDLLLRACSVKAV
jgi:transposase-like protein